MEQIAIYGFGGLGREIATIISSINKLEKKWEFIGFIDDNIELGTQNNYGQVLGGIDYINKRTSKLNLIIAIANPLIIEKIVATIRNEEIVFPTIIAPDVLFFDESSVIMGQGNVITYGCRLSCGVCIGDFNILNGEVSLGHDVEIANYNILLPETRISGEVKVGNSNLFGARSFVYQGVEIANATKMAAGSFITKNTKDHNLYMGNPARSIDII